MLPSFWFLCLKKPSSLLNDFFCYCFSYANNWDSMEIFACCKCNSYIPFAYEIILHHTWTKAFSLEVCSLDEHSIFWGLFIYLLDYIGWAPNTFKCRVEGRGNTYFSPLIQMPAESFCVFFPFVAVAEQVKRQIVHAIPPHPPQNSFTNIFETTNHFPLRLARLQIYFEPILWQNWIMAASALLV